MLIHLSASLTYRKLWKILSEKASDGSVSLDGFLVYYVDAYSQTLLLKIA